MKQQLIAKFAKKFAFKESKNENNVLAGVHYASGGTAFITNRHYGLRIQNAHKLESSVTIHAAKGVPIEGVYPEFGRVFPDSFDLEFELPAIDLMLDRVKYVAETAIKINKKMPIAKLQVLTDGGALTLKAQTEGELVACTAILTYTAVGKDRFGVRTLNAEYFRTALEVFVEANSKKVYLKTGEKAVSPIVLTDGADIDVIVLPYNTQTA